MKVTYLFILLQLFSCSSSPYTEDREYMKGSTLWVQNAAEWRALYYQAFNWAKIVLDNDLKKKSRRKRAIVVDIDETVLDNSPYQAKGILENEKHNTLRWEDWVRLGKAKPVPGAIDFLKYVNGRGIEIFYISNRKIKLADATYKNMVDEGVPVKKHRLLLRTQGESKESRRKEVLKDYRIVLLVGDALSDFHESFENKPISERYLLADKYQKQWGSTYIVLPNPMYGEWEKSIYKNDPLRKEIKRKKDREDHLYPY